MGPENVSDGSRIGETPIFHYPLFICRDRDLAATTNTFFSDTKQNCHTLTECFVCVAHKTVSRMFMLRSQRVIFCFAGCSVICVAGAYQAAKIVSDFILHELNDSTKAHTLSFTFPLLRSLNPSRVAPLDEVES